MTSVHLPANKPAVVDSVAEVRQTIAAARAAGKIIGLVPTMGALHEGHLSLVRASHAECSFTAVTIFVNPTQFGPNEDLDRYPRTWQADLDALAREDVDLVFAPQAAEIYPPGFSTFVEPPAAAAPWDGACRPGHFRGVATVVLKLFHLIPADFAYFGQKDFQQTLVIRRMVADLNLPINIRVCPIVREPDGLAMSSRNVYLSPDQRRSALAISRGLNSAAELARQGEQRPDKLIAAVRQVIDEAGITQIDYIAVADPETLEPLTVVESTAVILVAVHVGQTRLIDNYLIQRD